MIVGTFFSIYVPIMIIMFFIGLAQWSIEKVLYMSIMWPIALFIVLYKALRRHLNDDL